MGSRDASLDSPGSDSYTYRPVEPPRMSDHDDHGHDEGHDDHGHGHDDRPDYDPSNKELPSGEPPLRDTAPQSPYTGQDVGVGFAVLLVGLLLTFGLALGFVGV